MRESEENRTAMIASPGGFGTFDEFFEILTLIQARKIGKKYPIPVILLNYSGYYAKLMEFIEECKKAGTISQEDIDLIWCCNDNRSALDRLADFYNIPAGQRPYLAKAA